MTPSVMQRCVSLRSVPGRAHVQVCLRVWMLLPCGCCLAPSPAATPPHELARGQLLMSQEERPCPHPHCHHHPLLLLPLLLLPPQQPPSSHALQQQDASLRAWLHLSVPLLRLRRLAAALPSAAAREPACGLPLQLREWVSLPDPHRHRCPPPPRSRCSCSCSRCLCCPCCCCLDPLTHHAGPHSMPRPARNPVLQGLAVRDWGPLLDCKGWRLGGRGCYTLPVERSKVGSWCVCVGCPAGDVGWVLCLQAQLR